jgi:hypothetical protein
MISIFRRQQEDGFEPHREDCQIYKREEWL